MKDIGLKVLRFSDKEIFNNKQGGILGKIWRYCDS
jgi:very-short-patch-repair endonuclease